MKKISITDTTLRRAAEAGVLGFKEKLEIAKCLDRVNISAIELAPLTDSIFVKTLASLIHHTTLALPVGLTAEGVDRAWEALRTAARTRLVVDVPVSSVQMEYIARKKPEAMLDTIAQQVRRCVTFCPDVEFCATDASRADPGYLAQAIATALEAGATSVCLSDTAGALLPEQLGELIETLYGQVPALRDAFLKIMSDDQVDLAAAAAVRALQAGAAGVKTCLIGATAPRLKTICGIVERKGDSLGLYTAVKTTELDRTLERIQRLIGPQDTRVTLASVPEDSVTWDASDPITAIADGVHSLGYDLSEEELAKVYEEFLRLARKKPVSRKELDAIVAASAMQVPASYVLDSYVINSGSIITATACLKISHDGQTVEGISAGDGPIDAVFKAMEIVTGRHFELESFQIDAITEGKEAIGRAIVKLRSEGRLYSGSGVSTDIIGAAVRAYLGALNKIVYEEKEV